jgi:opacity protein-like surface antigen
MSVIARSIICSIVVVSLASPAALADIGQEVADQISAAQYRTYLDDQLYTRTGHDRGMRGDEHDLCRDFIASEFESFGLSVELDEFPLLGWRYNVIGTQIGTQFPDSYFIVSGHYDSVNNPGADDDASGIAGVLEVARVLSQYETAYTIKYIAWDMEEMGLLGSQHYVDEHEGDDIVGMIQMDMIAHDTGQYGMSVASMPSSSAWQDAVVASLNTYGGMLNIYPEGGSGRSDHAPFEQEGYQACLLIERGFEWNPCYHQPCDTVDTPGYISYDMATDCVRGVAAHMAIAAGAQAAPPCPTDLNGDGMMDLADLGILLASYDIDDGGDIDGDGDTDLADLGALLAAYDQPCG